MESKDFLKSNSLTVLAGDPSAGKSFLSTYIGACISAGKPLFGVEVPVGKVLYFSNEDVLEDTVVPRLINQGADLKPHKTYGAINGISFTGRR